MRPGCAAILTAMTLSGTTLAVIAFLGLRDLTADGCSDADLALIPMLETQGVLTAHPPQAIAKRIDVGCEEDEWYVYADKGYTVEDAWAVLPFYERIAQEYGWRLIGEGTGRPQCYGKSIGTASAFLTVWIDTDRDYRVTINAAHGDIPSDGGLMC